MALNVAASKAKIDRAFEHLRVLEREMPAYIEKNSPYALRFSEVDPQTGWCTVTVVPDKPPKPRFGIILGDVVHNLRSALDYIVTALLDRSGVTVTTQHSFPIFADAKLYAKKVGTATTALKGGALGGVTDGLGFIEQCQPYHRQGDAYLDPLWHIYRFNNADKHRLPPFLLALPAGEIKYGFRGNLVEKVETEEVVNWTPDKEFEIARLRFDPPVMTNPHMEGPVTLHAGFLTPSIGTEPEHSISLSLLRKSCSHVATLVKLFEQI